MSPSEPAIHHRANAASLVVSSPSGTRSRVVLDPLPFSIGRQADNHFVLRDNRASRKHARIVLENDAYVIEDLNSRNGVMVNGVKIARRPLLNGDRIEFGVDDSYALIFTREEDEILHILDQFSSSAKTPGAGNLGKLRALVEVARALQHSLSTTDVLAAVVDAALAVTGADRGFLLLKTGDDLEIAVARDRRGLAVGKDDLRVPTRIIHRALKQRRELLSMRFDPMGEDGLRPEMSVADLELRSVVCVPLVRIRAALSEETHAINALNETVGLLYLDSRDAPADLAAGNRELLQTLALEASTILENARLLEEERAKQKMEEELNIARLIQSSLLPQHLPKDGWFRAAGASIPSHQVGGDYFDVRQIGGGCSGGREAWCAVVADVSGKGVSSALLASLLQGALLLASTDEEQIREMFARIGRFLNERTQGEKYATVFYCTVEKTAEGAGLMRWVNAGHCAPFLLHADGTLEKLNATGVPLGMIETATYDVKHTALKPLDKVIIYSDGITEAQDIDGAFFDGKIRDVLRAHAGESSGEVHEALLKAVDEFTEGASQGDDMTDLVLEFR